ncbi:MAG: TfoX/Sxy family DNA transformation protein [Aureliella sp.]
MAEPEARDRVSCEPQRISEMRNLGPACEADFAAAGIHTADQLRHLGVEEAFTQMLIGRLQHGRSTKCCNAAYLYAIHGALHDCDWRELSDETKSHYKAFAAELRSLGPHSRNRSKR